MGLQDNNLTLVDHGILVGLARRVCPNWQSPTGDAHCKDVRRILEEAYDLGFDRGKAAAEREITASSSGKKARSS